VIYATSRRQLSRVMAVSCSDWLKAADRLQERYDSTL
jgi:hypothetical protein